MVENRNIDIIEIIIPDKISQTVKKVIRETNL